LNLEFRLFPTRASDSVARSGFDSMQMRGDYLTEEEDGHVREAQLADVRAKVFMKIADRRLQAIVGPPASPTDKKDQKKIEEEEREWGAVPKVSRVDLLRHYARAISECMAKLEDAYERNPKSSALPKALTILREATDKHLQMLQKLKVEMKTEAEIAAISGALYEAETANKGARDGLK
jgi:Fe2+ transport system protein B